MAGRKDIVDLALKMVMGEGSDAAKASIRAYHGTPQPTENLIDLFHGTTPEAFDAITSSGDIFGSSRFSPRRDVAETFAHNVGGNANTVVKVKAPASSLMVDLDLPAAKLLTPDEAAAYLDKPDWTILDFIENGYSVGVPDTSVLSIERASGGSIREGYGPGGWVDDVVKMAGKVIEGEGDNVTRLSDVKSARARDALIKQLKSSINQVKSGYFQAGRQALINQKSMDLHKSGMLPLQQGTIVNPPSTWDMPGDWRVSGYWYDEKDPRRFGYRLQNESGQTYDAAASDPRAGLKRDNPYSFGAGFKAYAGPNAAPPKPVASPVEKPAATPKPPEVLDAINKEYEGLFGSEDPFKPRAHGGRIAKGPGGWLDDVVKMAGKVISGEGEDAAKTGIRAYQGSPHNFAAERLVRFPEGRTEYLVGQPDVLPDVPEGAEVVQDFPLGRMRMDKIGTGEGAQAYGHGLYAAENERVAKGYRDALTDPEQVKIRINDKHIPSVWVDDLRSTFPEMYKGLSEADQDVMDSLLGTMESAYSVRDAANAAESVGGRAKLLFNQRVKPFVTKPEVGPGHIYEVNIAANPEQFLDWDKPLSEQPEVLAKLKPLLDDPAINQEFVPKFTGKDIMSVDGPLANYIGQRRTPADYRSVLKSEGIPGVKYLDAGSRGAGDGTRNYVVFDDKLISIIRKYGIAGASAMLGYNLMEQLDPKQALAASMADQDYQASRPRQSAGGNNAVSGAVNVARGLNGVK